MAIAIAGGLAVYPIVRAGTLMWAAAPLAMVALLSVVVAVVWRGRLTGAALFGLAAEYALVEITGRVGSLSVVAYAVGLVVLCELLLLLGRLPTSGSIDFGVVVELLLSLGVIGVGAAAIAILVLIAGGRWTGGALEAGLIGMTAAVLLCGLPWVLVRRGRSRGPQGPGGC